MRGKRARAQAIVEYTLVFLALAVAVILAFGGFGLGDRTGKGSTFGSSGLKRAFDDAVDHAIAQIRQ